MAKRAIWVGVTAAVVVAAVGGGVVIAAVSGGGHDMAGTDTTAAGMSGDGTMTAAGGTNGHGMGGHDMSPQDAEGATTAAPGAEGGRPLMSMREDRERVFRLSVGKVTWTIAPGTRVNALAYNAQVPGPVIRGRVGDRVRVDVTNTLDEPTSVHWHGMSVPNAMDGAGDVTQKPIQPGETFSYRFTLTRPGTFFYHSHTAADRQVALGLSGALIVDGGAPEPVAADVPMMLGEWTLASGGTIPSMEMEGAFPNWFTINGKSWPDTAVIRVKTGESVRIRFIGAGQFAHPMHIHGGSFRIVATDGNPVPRAAQLRKDTVMVAPGERYDVLWTAERKGTWLVHCHILHHTTNDGAEVNGGGGLTTAIVVS